MTADGPQRNEPARDRIGGGTYRGDADDTDGGTPARVDGGTTDDIDEGAPPNDDGGTTDDTDEGAPTSVDREGATDGTDGGRSHRGDSGDVDPDRDGSDDESADPTTDPSADGGVELPVGAPPEDSTTGRVAAWILATRPQTFPAAIAPVLVGTAVAVPDGVFAPMPALAALLGALLIQIGTNLANDYYDAVKGADTDRREGFTRATAEGLLPARQVKLGAFVTFGLAILLGTYLVYVGGLPIVLVGLTGVFFGWAYTAGPYPLGYHGLGDLFAFVYFGPVAVVGTYYVQAAATLLDPLVLVPPAETVSAGAVLAGVGVGTMVTAILVVNNVRDREEDARTGKRTLAVRFGYRFSRVQYALLLAVSFLVPIWFFTAGGWNWTVLAPLATIPYALVVTWTVWTHTDGRALNPALKRTGILLVGYAVLFAMGLVA